MKFHEFKTLQANHPQEYAKRMKPGEFYEAMLSGHFKEAKTYVNAINTGNYDLDATHFIMEVAYIEEASWFLSRRPFYHAYPAVCKCLAKTPLDFSIPQLALELKPTAICFAVGHEPIALGEKVSAVMFGLPNDSSFRLRVNFLSGNDKLLQAKNGNKISTWGMQGFEQIVSLCIGLAMLAKDERFAEPILLLNRDADRELTPEQHAAAIERATRNGRNGIAIGKHLDISPHMRRPHFGIRWTEKGRSTPKLVPIKGCLVSRSKLYPIPTGYMDAPCST